MSTPYSRLYEKLRRAGVNRWEARRIAQPLWVYVPRKVYR